MLGPILYNTRTILCNDDLQESLETTLSKIFANETMLIGKIVDLSIKWLVHSQIIFSDRQKIGYFEHYVI